MGCCEVFLENVGVVVLVVVLWLLLSVLLVMVMFGFVVIFSEILLVGLLL